MSAWLNEHRTLVDQRLRAFFAEKTEYARALDVFLSDPVEELEAFTMRGGKRLRGALTAAAYAAVSGNESLFSTIDVAAALELLQSYLLIHDDWMDQDDLRRGGPTVHASLRRRHSDHTANSLAILCGDLASAYSWELLSSAPFPSFVLAARAFAEAHEDVIFGQHLDVTGDLNTDLVHLLKTTSYSVRLPLELGALLGGASDRQRAALHAFAVSLGAAFQLRDDLLGVFGDAETTGKTSASDLMRQRKTAVVLDGIEHSAGDSPLSRVLGNVSATDAEVHAARAYLVEIGTQARIEKRIAEHANSALNTLQNMSIAENGRARLEDLVGLLTARAI